MIKYLILALCLTSTIAAINISQDLTFYWAYDRLCGSTSAPFMWATTDPARFKAQTASPVFWQAYTIFPRFQQDKYHGGVNCGLDMSCVITTDTQTVVWSYQGMQTFTGKPNIITTKFSWDATDPTKSDQSFSAFLAVPEQDVPTWPKHTGYNRDFTTY